MTAAPPPMLSTVSQPIASMAPVVLTRAWGTATLSPGRKSRTVVLALFIPSGWKIRLRTKSSHSMPLAAFTTSPATT